MQDYLIFLIKLLNLELVGIFTLTPFGSCNLVYPHPNVFHSFKYLCQLIFNNETIYDDKPYFIVEDVCIFFEKILILKFFWKTSTGKQKEISFYALEQKNEGLVSRSK